MSKQKTVTLTMPDGRRKYFRGATKKEAERKREEARRAMEAGIDISVKTTVAEFSSVWLEEYKRGSIRESSYMTLDSIVRSHIIPAIGSLQVKSVRPAHIQKMLRDRANLSRSTQQRILSITRSIFEVAIENSLILNNPCVKSIKVAGVVPDEKTPLTAEQETMLLDRARGTKIYMFVRLGLCAGLRRGELLGLQWGDIDFETGMLNVERSIAPSDAHPDGDVNTDLKTKAARRTIPLPWSVAEELRAEKARAKSVYVITGRRNSYLGIAALSYHWKKITDDLPFYVTPHKMRHTRITRWFEQGLDLKEVQYLAGHTTSRMTLDVYTHYQKDSRLESTAQKIRAAL